MKCEKINPKKRSGLKNEIDVQLRLNKSPYFLDFYDSGEYEKWKFVIMELLGPSLSKICRVTPDKRFSKKTWIRTAEEMLKCIREFHNQGFVHRDIKPSNFLIRSGSENFLVLIDYGMAKEYRDFNTGKIIPQSDEKKFRGTVRYASPYALVQLDQGRRDDLYSWFYSICELFSGKLPWDTIADRPDMRSAKKMFESNIKMYYPQVFVDIYKEISKLGFEDEPNYDAMNELLESCYDVFKVERDDEPLDWMNFGEDTMKYISSFPLDSGPEKKIYSYQKIISSYSSTSSDGSAQVKCIPGSSVCLLV